jgi:tetratricopeptide (TPR) repeat protein
VRVVLALVVMAAGVGSAWSQTLARSPRSYQRCQTLRHHGQLKQAKSCFASLTRLSSHFERAEGYWGLDQYEDANQEFNLASKQEPNSTDVRAEWGRLFLERFNPQEAVNLFDEALQLDPNYAPAHLGLARVAAQGYDQKAVDFAHQALSHDPKLFEAHELLAYLALEDSDRKTAGDEAHQALSISGDALDALSVLASMDFLDGKTSSPWADLVLKVNPVYGQLYATAAHFFVINRRYDEGVAFYRKALALNPELWDARSELGLNLMRLGEIGEARQQLEKAYNAHYRNAQTKNALTVLDSLSTYQTFTSRHGVVVLQKKEAELLRPYVEAELEKSIAIYERKYKMKLPGPVRLEVYPNHEDFIVRTLGLPGQGGLLGVTFGLVVAMDSPSARAPGQFNWATTIRHEMSHVFVVTATHHLVPRWFTEGLAVHEESATNPRWGDRLTPDIVTALRNNKLLPVLELERGFVRPRYPTQVMVSYYQAGRMCDYIAQRWGDDALLGMVHSFGDRKTTEQVIQENLHVTPEQFDKEFAAWLDKQTQVVVQNFDAWKKQMDAAHAKLNAGQARDAIKESQSAANLYRDYVQGGSAYEVLAKAQLAQGDIAGAAAALEVYKDRGGHDVATLKQLGDLEQKLKQPNKAIDTFRAVLEVYLEDEEVHRKLGTLELESGDPSAAVREYRAVLTLHPSDTAQSHYDLARALLAAQRTSDAREEVLASLEVAPDFKPAQQLLLKLSK